MNSKIVMFLLSALIIVAGCKKDDPKKVNDNTPPSTSGGSGTGNSGVYDFTWSNYPVYGSTITFTSNAPEGYKHTWNFGGGHIYTEYTNTVKYGYGSEGVYTVSLTINDDEATKVTKEITVGKLPYYNHNGLFPMCVGDTIRFTCSDSTATSYRWDFGDGTIDTSLTFKPIHIYTKTGSYYTRLKVNNQNEASCNERTITIINDPIHTNKLVGTHTWKSLFWITSNYGFDTTFPVENLNITINYYNKTTVTMSPPSRSISQLLGFEYMSYTASESKGNVLAYTPFGRNTYPKLYYDHVADTFCIKVEGSNVAGNHTGKYNYYHQRVWRP